MPGHGVPRQDRATAPARRRDPARRGRPATADRRRLRPGGRAAPPAGAPGRAHVRARGGGRPGPRAALLGVAAGPGRAGRGGARTGAGPDPSDAALVATPPGSHAALAIACLAAGRHVLVEKPLAPTLAEARQVARAATLAGREVAVGFGRRFRDSYRSLWSVLAGRPPRRLEALLVTRAAGWGAGQGPATAEGVVTDAGCHLLDLLPWLAGRPLVAVAGARARREGGTLSVAFTAELADGLEARCVCGHGAAHAERVGVELADGRRWLAHPSGLVPGASPALAHGQEWADLALRRLTRRPNRSVERPGASSPPSPP